MRERVRRALVAGSGPEVARLFHRLLAAVFLVAWISLGSQVQLLIGSSGLLPLAPFLDGARSQLPLPHFPTHFWLGASDGALTAGIVVGVGLAVAWLGGLRPRLCAALSTALYLSYATACRTFLSFQWDNLLLECGFVASFLSANRPAPLVHILLRMILFKLYFESGIAKWQSPYHDWHDGSAMTHYYETAPLPTWIAWHFHNLPAWWHRLESRGTLVLELAVPFGMLGARRVRQGTAFILTAFQVGNALTANYGFFCHLSAALHVLLLDDADIRRARQWLRARLRRGPARNPTTASEPAAWAKVPSALGWLGATILVVLSTVEGVTRFTTVDPRVIAPLRRLYAPLRVVNTYHLFAAITRERIEPEVQTLPTWPGEWTAHHLRHKPGNPLRAPDFVAPHQPRVDFQLWFYGLAYERKEPAYVAALVRSVCRDPETMQGLFLDPLPRGVVAARLVYWRYNFTTPAERRETGAWWGRTLVTSTPPVACDALLTRP